MFAGHAIQLELRHMSAWAACQFSEAHLRLPNWPEGSPPELPVAVLEKFPCLPTSFPEKELVYSL